MVNLIGQKLGQYKIISLLGKGGMATVYRARQTSMDRDVAIKVIKPDLAEAADFVTRFQREAKTIASLSHTNILKVFDYGQYDDLVYLVMELLPGGSLADLIRRGPLALDRVSKLLEQIAAALDYAHSKGIIHRDLKPQNVLLDEGGVAHLSDFGIAKLLTETSNLTQTGAALGTPAYMSPEQWQGRALDARADLYSLGVMLFEMLTGNLPFTGDTPATLMYKHLNEPSPSARKSRGELPETLEVVIQTALAKDPDERYVSASAVADAFKMALQGETVVPKARATVRRSPSAPDEDLVATQLAPPAGKTVSGNASSSRHKLSLGVLGALVVVIAAITLLVVNKSNAPTDLATAQNSGTTQTKVVGFATEVAPTTASADTPVPAVSSSATPFTAVAVVPLSATPTLTSTPNQERTLAALVAATRTARATAATNTPTPDIQQTVAIIVGITDTAAARVVLVNETFSEPLTLNFVAHQGNWKVMPDETGNAVFDINTSSGEADTSFGEDTWKNIAIEYRVRILDAGSDGPTVNLRFRQQNEAAYNFALTNQNSWFWFSESDSHYDLGNDHHMVLQKNVWYHIRVEIWNSQFKAFIDDRLANQAADSRLTNGSFGFHIQANAHVQFDDIRVIDLGG